MSLDQGRRADEEMSAPNGAGSALGSGSPDVLFAVLPFAEVATPVIAAGLLQAKVVPAGFRRGLVR